MTSRIERIMQASLNDKNWKKVTVVSDNEILPQQTNCGHQGALIATKISTEESQETSTLGLHLRAEKSSLDIVERSKLPLQTNYAYQGTPISTDIPLQISTDVKKPTINTGIIGPNQSPLQAMCVIQEATKIANQVQEPTEAGTSGLQLRKKKRSLEKVVPGTLSEESDPYASSGSSYKPIDSSGESEDQVEDENINEIPDGIPKKRKKRRCKKANKLKWKRAIVKDLRLSGKKYVNRSGKTVDEKKPKIVDCSKCRFRCNIFFEEGHRELICKEYYALADYKRQKIYLSSLMENIPIHRKKNNPVTKNRNTSRVYYLKKMEGIRQRVCQKFFCATFSLSHRVIEKCVDSMSETGLFVGYDKRADSKPYNETKEIDKQRVQEHINLFQRIESHYCRRDSTKHYLSPDLNISIMYRLYLEFCVSQNILPVSQFVYQRIFHNYDPALAFYKPKKDQCSVCNAFVNSKEKELLREEYENHKRREKESMDMKEEDKKQARMEQGATFRAITFDLQAILPVPFAGDCQIYYKQHLNVYNFTIFDSSTRDGFCYIWDEIHGSKGSSEIGSCLLKYLQSLPATVENVASNQRESQNRNKFVATAMLFAVNTIEHLKTIDLKFMESGHSYLEADSMHSTIERARAHKKIYSTREWCLLVSAARLRPKPYDVYNLKYSDFNDLQQLTESMVYNTAFNTRGDKVSWMRIKWIRLQKCKPNIFQYKYDLSSEEFSEIDISETKRRSGRKRNWASAQLSCKYSGRIAVSEKKKKDLVYLLNKKIIPDDYSDFINNIPTTSNTADLTVHADSD